MSDAPQAELAERKPTKTAQALASYIRAQTGAKVDQKSVSLTMLLTKEFRGSAEQVAAREARKAERLNHAENVAERAQARRQARHDKLVAEAEAVLKGEKRGPGRPRRTPAVEAEPEVAVVDGQYVEADDFTQEEIDGIDDDSDDDDDDDEDEDF